jgi:hypothetical protein
MLLWAQRDDITDGPVDRHRIGRLDVVGDSATVAHRSFGRVPERRPRCPPADQIVHGREPERLEACAGTAAEVAVLVEAVHEQRGGSLPGPDLVGLERLERQTRGAREMLLLVDRRRKHVEDADSIGDQLARLGRVDANCHTTWVPRARRPSDGPGHRLGGALVSRKTAQATPRPTWIRSLKFESLPRRSPHP